MPDSALVKLLRQRVAHWNQTHPNQQIDPAAELAVASQEGLSGGIGDGGHAFGPNQLNDAGGVWTGRYRGLTPQQKNAIAWSPAGIDEALAGVARASGGEHGAQAVRDIVTRFERPAQPGREVAGALRSYGIPVAAGAPVVSPLRALAGSRPGAAGGLTAGQEAALLGANQAVGLSTSPMLMQLLASATQKAAPAPRRAPTAGGSPMGPVKLTGFDGIQLDASIAPEVARLTHQFGVTPTSGYRSASHNQAVGGASNSDHLRGDAVDFSGSPSALASLYKWAQGRFPYVEPWSQTHGTHVHVSFKR